MIVRAAAPLSADAATAPSPRVQRAQYRPGRRRTHAVVVSWGEIRMRSIVAALLSCLLVACSGIPQSAGSTCSTRDECEIQGYARAP
jgi:hypothetical protein